MKRLWVWAPLAQSVEAVIDGQRLPMKREDTGIHTLERQLAPGTRYGFSLEPALDS